MNPITVMCATVVGAVVLTAVSPGTITITSPAFNNNEHIPAKYTCEGENINPPLMFSSVPEEAKSLALIMDDPDAVKGTFDHWVMWNIPVSKDIQENSAVGVEGKNGKDKKGYTGPCPPAGTGVHHYNFYVYALDTNLEILENSSKKDLEKAMEGHILARGKLTGLYKKQGTTGM